MGETQQEHPDDNFIHPAFKAARASMLAGRHIIDESFGTGFAQENPVLLAAFMQAATHHLRGELAAGAYQARSCEIASLVSRVADAIKEVALESGARHVR